MTKSLLGAALLAALPFPVVAQDPASDRPATAIVLDASGSMWGQIDGVNKIVIARNVLTELLDDLPDDMALGLTTYGHRRKGDCGDIETLIAPMPGQRDAIRAAVAGLNPKGKTPLSDAVVAAAEALRATEQAATVILISDGLETCDADPCAVGRALEASGVDFTAHVVGFDVEGDPVARAQLQCLAEATGGQYLPANDAGQLRDALTQVATAQPTPAETPDPAAPLQLSFAATELYGEVSRPVATRWTITDAAGAPLHSEETDSGSGLTLPAGSYGITAERLSDGTRETREVTLVDASQTVTVTFSAPLPPASLDAPATGSTGATLPVTWTGPNAEGDYLDTARPDAPAQSYETYAYTVDGNPLALRLPAQPGDYVIRYIDASSFQVLAETPVTVTATGNSVQVPTSAPIGSRVEVAWQGAGHAEDYIDVALPGSDPLTYIGYSYTGDGNPLVLQLPTTPGTYEVRYITAQDSSVAARTTIEVTNVTAKLEAPATVTAGQSFDLRWEGPGNPGDYLTVALPDDGPLGYTTYAYTEAGQSLTLTAPDTPGTYALRYIIDGPDARVLTERPLTVQ